MSTSSLRWTGDASNRPHVTDIDDDADGDLDVALGIGAIKVAEASYMERAAVPIVALTGQGRASLVGEIRAESWRARRRSCRSSARGSCWRGGGGAPSAGAQALAVLL